MTHPSVPIGSEDVASIRKEVGRRREFTFPVKNHVELGLALDLFDFEAASEVSGTKFYYLENEAVLLELALINWTLSQLLSKGFVPLSTPDLVPSTVVEKCVFQPRGQNTQVLFFVGIFSRRNQSLSGRHCRDSSRWDVYGQYVTRGIITIETCCIFHIVFEQKLVLQVLQPGVCTECISLANWR
ncbi:hypothetical protein CY35_02G208500 [Sphagnum magellanicum]|nr:hypothetical protein CY35_02G208500 [Sphagnum magellanicum]KAH9573435.1 hypothetical protein CY35_02G208500 [Sphagnum magellanicum]